MTLPLRPNVCMLIFNVDGKLFLGERHGQPGIWQFPQGGVDEGTSPEEAVVKELDEELGLKPNVFRIIKKLEATHSYEWETPPSYAKSKWRGQAQTFWLIQFLGSDSDIDLSSHEQELMSWKWCTVNEVLKMAEPKRVTSYQKPLVEFNTYIQLVMQSKL